MTCEIRWSGSEPPSPGGGFTTTYSLEMVAGDLKALNEAALLIAPGTTISVAFLPSENMDERVAAAARIHALGFAPMPHLSARRIESIEQLRIFVQRLVDEGHTQQMLLVAGDPAVPEGQFEDTLSMIRTGVFESAGVKCVGIAGHPEGHPFIDTERLWTVMERKVVEIASRGMDPVLVTQFAFDAAPVLQWLETMRERGIEAPVRIGIPGPAGIKRLLRYASICGVGASAAVLKKYGVSLTKLAGSTGPDKLVHTLRKCIGPEHGEVELHYYPFGGLRPTVEWIDKYVSQLDK